MSANGKKISYDELVELSEYGTGKPLSYLWAGTCGLLAIGCVIVLIMIAIGKFGNFLGGVGAGIGVVGFSIATWKCFDLAYQHKKRLPRIEEAKAQGYDLDKIRRASISEYFRLHPLISPSEGKLISDEMERMVKNKEDTDGLIDAIYGYLEDKKYRKQGMPSVEKLIEDYKKSKKNV